jgi:5-methyltetrahydrofolate--homocysteine methyltransferase
VRIVQDTVDLPVCIDSANPEALAAGLKAAQGRALVNSVNGETEKLQSVLPVVAEYGAAVIALCMDDDGIPSTSEDRLRVAEKLVQEAEAVGIAADALLIDPLVMAVGADHTAGKTTVEAALLIREALGCNMTAGASNVSHGMPEREVLNTVFLTLLAQAGVNAPICNPLKNGLAVRAIDLLMGKDDFGMQYIGTYRSLKAE